MVELFRKTSAVAKKPEKKIFCQGLVSECL